MFTKDPFFWVAVRNTIWIIVVGLPIRIVVRDHHRAAADAEAPGRERLPDDVLPADDGPGGRRDARVRVSAESRLRAGQRPVAQDRHLASTAVVLLTAVVEARARPPRPLGCGRRDDHLPCGVPRRAQAPVRGGRSGGGKRVREVPAREPADGVARDLLRGRHGDHLRIPVLHPGLRRRGRQLADGAIGDPQNSTLVLLGASVRAGLHQLQDGLRIGDGLGVAGHLPRLHGGHPARLDGGGCTIRAGRSFDEQPGESATEARRLACRRGYRTCARSTRAPPMSSRESCRSGRADGARCARPPRTRC